MRGNTPWGPRNRTSSFRWLEYNRCIAVLGVTRRKAPRNLEHYRGTRNTFNSIGAAKFRGVNGRNFQYLGLPQGIRYVKKKQYAKFRMHELASLWSNETELLRQTEILRKQCKELDEELHSRNLAIRSLKTIINKLQKQVSSFISIPMFLSPPLCSESPSKILADTGWTQFVDSTPSVF